MYMLKRLDLGKSVVVGCDVGSVQMKELLLSAFQVLGIPQVSPLKFKPDEKTNLLKRFPWLLSHPAASKETIGSSSSSDEQGPLPIDAKRVRYVQDNRC